MKRSTDLFDLIKSLTPSEKVYFKKNLPKEEKNYTLLFNVMDSITTYDEQKIKQTLVGYKFLNQFHVAKNYLYKQIMASLKNYNRGKNILNELRELEYETSILFEKGLLKQALVLIKKGIKKAKDHEIFISLIHFTNHRISIASASAYEELSEKELQDLFKERDDAIEFLKNVIVYAKLSLKAGYYAALSSRIRTEKEKEIIETIQKEILTLGEDSAHSFSAKSAYFSSLDSCSRLLSDHLSYLEYCQKNVQLMEQNPIFIETKPYSYVLSLGSLLFAQGETNKYENQEEIIYKLRNFPTTSKYYLLEIDCFIYTNKFNHFFKTGDLANAKNEIEKIITFLSDNIKILDEERIIVFQFNISLLYFYMNDFSKALLWNSKIINADNKSSRSDIYSSALLFNLILHIELNNLDLLAYRIKSIHHIFYQKKRLFPFEKIILHFVKTVLPKVKNDKDLLQAYQKLKEQLVKIKESRYDSSALDDFNFIAWLESKIENRPFVEVIKEQFSEECSTLESLKN